MSDDSSEKKDKKKHKKLFSDLWGLKRKDVTEETILSVIDAGEEPRRYDRAAAGGLSCDLLHRYGEECRL